jgi:uncharacterized protein YsxB (DUF464 family)
MVMARMYWNRMRLEVDGHAGGGTAGNDLICAGASMLVSALGAALEQAEKRGRCEAECEDGDGHAMVWAYPGMGCSNEIRAYFKMCIAGFRMLAERYPGNVKMEEVN